MADEVEEFRERHELLHNLLARGVPWPLALEAASSTAIDDDDRARTISIETTRGGDSPSWWRDDDDGVRIVDRD